MALIVRSLQQDRLWQAEHHISLDSETLAAQVEVHGVVIHVEGVVHKSKHEDDIETREIVIARSCFANATCLASIYTRV